MKSKSRRVEEGAGGWFSFTSERFYTLPPAHSLQVPSGFVWARSLADRRCPAPATLPFKGEIDKETSKQVVATDEMKFMNLPALLAIFIGLCGASKTLMSPSYDFLGPFQIGKAELDSDPTEIPGIVALHDAYLHKKRGSVVKLTSELLSGGKVSWEKLSVDKSSRTVQVNPTANWNGLAQQLSDVAVFEFQGWAVGALRVSTDPLDSGPVRVTLRCTGVTAAFLHRPESGNKTTSLEQFMGDIYNSNWIATVFELSPHTNYRVFAFIRGRATSRFSCSADVVSSEAGLSVRTVLVAPDIVSGNLLGDVVGIVAQNNARATVESIRCAVEGRFLEAQSEQPSELRIQSGAVLALPCRLKVRNDLYSSVCGPGVSSVPFALRLEGCIRESAVRCRSVSSPSFDHTVRCRTLNQSAAMTYLDHDGSAALAAVIAPLGAIHNGTENGVKFPVILSLHGTGVSGLSQADAYKQMLPKESDYTFGVAGFWVLAPDRFGAHNWQGVGQYSAFAALRALAALTVGLELPRADDARVLFGGHSMGGAGAWFACTAAPDLAIAAAPASGWLVKEGYGDSNLFMRLDASEPYGHPRLAAALLSAVRDQRGDAFAAALQGIPTHVRVGANDDTVAAYHSRRMVRLLRETGAGGAPVGGKWPTLEEMPQKGHWWWDTASANDGGVLNDPMMRAFYEAQRSRLSGHALFRAPPLGSAEADSSLPGSFTILASNARTHFTGRGGISIIQLMYPQTEGIILVDQRDHSWVLSTSRVLRIRVQLPENYRRPSSISVDETSFPASDFGSITHFCMIDAGRWHVCFGGIKHREVEAILDGSGGATVVNMAQCEWDFEKTQRGPHNTGPIRAVTAAPFLIVFGTQVSDLSERLRDAASLLSQEHAAAFHTLAPVVADSDLEMCDEQVHQDSSRMCLSCGTNLILIGGPRQNLWTARLHSEPQHGFSSLRFDTHDTGPIQSFRVDGKKFREPGIALVALVGFWDSRDSCRPSSRSIFNSIDPAASRARLALVVTGTDSDGLFNALRFSAPTIPPMVRGPFTNLVPDILVLDSAVRNRGYGGILLAGYFDNNWKLDTSVSWIS